MSDSVIYIFCAIITLVILLLFLFRYGVPLLYIIYAVNGSFIEWITSKFGKAAREHSARFANLGCLLVIIEVLLLNFVIYGIYKIVSSFITGNVKIDFTVEKPVSSYAELLTFVIVLFIFKSGLLIRYLYHTIRIYKNHKESVDAIYYKHLRSSLLSYVLFFVYLIGFYLLFTNEQTPDSLGILPTLAGCLFLPYLLYHLCKSSYSYIKYRKQIFPNFTFRDAVNMLPFFIFDFAFIYFFYLTAQYLWFSKHISF